jgi:hypothetical protein
MVPIQRQRSEALLKVGDDLAVNGRDVAEGAGLCGNWCCRYPMLMARNTVNGRG